MLLGELPKHSEKICLVDQLHLKGFDASIAHSGPSFGVVANTIMRRHTTSLQVCNQEARLQVLISKNDRRTHVLTSGCVIFFVEEKGTNKPKNPSDLS